MPDETMTGHERGPGRERDAGFRDRGRFRRFGRLAAVLMIAFYAALIFARLWPTDLRTTSTAHAAFSLLAFQIDTFAFHGGVALGALALVLTGMRKWRLVLAALPGLIFSAGPELWRFAPGRGPASAGAPIKVMSVNLLAFSGDRTSIAAEIAAEDADILLIQEYNQAWHDAIYPLIRERYSDMLTLPRPDCFGLAFFSKLPLERAVDAGLRLGGINLPAMRATVRYSDQSLTIYNLHLMPPAGVGQFRTQARQMADLLDRLRSESGPLIVAGDFNFTVHSVFGHALAALGMRDAHDEAGYGRGVTWPNHLPLCSAAGVRIDHIYIRGGLVCTGVRTGLGEGSDHRPVIATLDFARP